MHVYNNTARVYSMSVYVDGRSIRELLTVVCKCSCIMRGGPLPPRIMFSLCWLRITIDRVCVCVCVCVCGGGDLGKSRNVIFSLFFPFRPFPTPRVALHLRAYFIYCDIYIDESFRSGKLILRSVGREKKCFNKIHTRGSVRL
jgi:hypothetical protein